MNFRVEGSLGIEKAFSFVARGGLAGEVGRVGLEEKNLIFFIFHFQIFFRKIKISTTMTHK